MHNSYEVEIRNISIRVSTGAITTACGPLTVRESSVCNQDIASPFSPAKLT
jgi:hypothetical protein